MAAGGEVEGGLHAMVRPTHIMLSYCWAEKEIVKKLAARLGAAGKDVWRDEVRRSY